MDIDRGAIVVVLLGIVLFLATEFFFPINLSGEPEKDREVARRQKHFWALILFLFSLLLGFVINSQTETQARIRNVASVFDSVTNREVEARFRSIFSAYHKHFSSPSSMLKQWVQQAFDDFENDMSSGWISLPRESAAIEIGKVYGLAAHSIIATNFGDTGFYFAHQNYIAANQEATRNRVPVARIYIFDPREGRYSDRSDEGPPEPSVPPEPQEAGQEGANGLTPKEEFYCEVSELHATLGTVFSAVLDSHDLDSIRDILLVDNRFLAETKLSATFDPRGARATGSPDNLNKARRYFYALVDKLDGRFVARMPPEQLHKNFIQFERLLENETRRHHADVVFEAILRQSGVISRDSRLSYLSTSSSSDPIDCRGLLETRES